MVQMGSATVVIVVVVVRGVAAVVVVVLVTCPQTPCEMSHVPDSGRIHVPALYPVHAPSSPALQYLPPPQVSLFGSHGVRRSSPLFL